MDVRYQNVLLTNGCMVMLSTNPDVFTYIEILSSPNILGDKSFLQGKIGYILPKNITAIVMVTEHAAYPTRKELPSTRETFWAQQKF